MKSLKEPYFDDLLIFINAINSKFNTNYTVSDIYDSVIREYRKRSPLNEPVVNRLSLFTKKDFKIVLDEYKSGDIYLKAYIEDTNYPFSYLQLINITKYNSLECVEQIYTQSIYIQRFVELHNAYLTYLYNTNQNTKMQYESQVAKTLNYFLDTHNEVITLDIIQDPDKFIARYCEFEGYNITILSEILAYIRKYLKNKGYSA